MAYLFYFIFGAAIGSFVNVIVSRLHVAPILTGRSKCLTCGHSLSLVDLVPIVSHIFLRGKCRYCHAPYGTESLVVECLYGVVFVALYQVVILWQSDITLMIGWGVYYTLLFITLGVMALYDKKHMYIPMLFLLLYCVLTFMMLILRYSAEPTYLVLLGPLLVSLPFLLIWIISQGRAIGFGDVIIFAGIGAFFGVLDGFSVILFSVWIGALVGIYMYLTSKKESRRNIQVPFVPFIVLGFLLVLFTGVTILTVASSFV